MDLEYKPTGDQSQAIDKLVKGIIDGKKHQTFSQFSFICFLKKPKKD